ncbi:MAG: hypothetical protein V1821_02045, partial [bacterium]
MENPANFPSKFEEVVITVSDFHLASGGEGASDPDRTLEDFFCDQEFSDSLNHLQTKYSRATHLRLNLLGDTFNPLNIPIDGHYNLVPTEKVCLDQMRIIIQAHPR